MGAGAKPYQNACDEKIYYSCASTSLYLKNISFPPLPSSTLRERNNSSGIVWGSGLGGEKTHRRLSPPIAPVIVPPPLTLPRRCLRSQTHVF